MAEEIEKHRKVQSQSKLAEKVNAEEVKELAELRETCNTEQLAIEKLEKEVESVRKSANEQAAKSQHSQDRQKVPFSKIWHLSIGGSLEVAPGPARNIQ